MMNKFLQEKLKLDKKKKERTDKMLKIAVLVIVLGYVFFFTSNFFFPKVYKNKEVTPIGNEINMEDYVITLDSWDYSKEDRSFELIFEFKNLTTKLKPEMEFTCMKDSTRLDTAIYKNYENKIIVRVTDTPRNWQEVYMNIEIDGKYAKVNTNDKEVHMVSHIVDRNREEYDIYALEQKSNGYKKQISKIENLLEKEYKKMEIAYERTDELKKQKKTQTKSEKEKTDENIEKIRTEYLSAFEYSKKLNEEKVDLQKKIKNIALQLKKKKNK